jgi:hypothetical protein
MFLGNVESLYCCVTNCVTSSSAIFSKKVFSFYLLLRRMLFAHMTNAFSAAMLIMSLSICKLLAVLCTLHTSDPACLLRGKLFFLSHPFYTVTMCVCVKIQKLLHKSTSQDIIKFIQ